MYTFSRSLCLDTALNQDEEVVPAGWMLSLTFLAHAKSSHEDDSVPEKLHVWTFLWQAHPVTWVDGRIGRKPTVTILRTPANKDEKKPQVWRATEIVLNVTANPLQLEIIERIITLAKRSDSSYCSYGCVAIISGPPGVGKSTVPLLLAVQLRAKSVYHLRSCDGWEDFGCKQYPYVIIVDECETVIQAWGKTRWNDFLDHVNRANNAFVVMTTNKPFSFLDDAANVIEGCMHADASLCRPGRVNLRVVMARTGDGPGYNFPYTDELLAKQKRRFRCSSDGDFFMQL
jgi:hypothetical protein